MKKSAVVFLAFGFVASGSAQVPSAVRPAFREKALEAIQDLDGIEVLSSEIAYSLNYLNARKSVMVAARMAIGERETTAANSLNGLLQATSACRVLHQSGGTGVIFQECMTDEAVARTKALEAAGIDPAKVYPHPPSSPSRP